MESKLLTHVGGRIRFYRKYAGMSMETLAEKVDKSKATISKYELGKIAVDVATLYAIAEALHVHPHYLMDLEPAWWEPPKQRSRHPLKDRRSFFLYHMQRGNIYSSLLQLMPDYEDAKCRVTMFHRVQKLSRPENCSCVYHGEGFRSDLCWSFVLQNPQSNFDCALLQFTLPLHPTNRIFGMISGLGSNTHFPTSLKVLLSVDPVAGDEELKELLTIRSEVKKIMVQHNEFFIPL